MVTLKATKCGGARQLVGRIKLKRDTVMTKSTANGRAEEPEDLLVAAGTEVNLYVMGNLATVVWTSKNNTAYVAQRAFVAR